MTAQARSRTVILALACLGHLGLFLLAAGAIGAVRYRTPARESEPLLLTLLDNLVHPEPVPAEVPAPMLTPPGEVFTGPLPPIDSSGSVFEPPVSDSVPHVDWIDERRREVAHVLGQEPHEPRPGTTCASTSGKRVTSSEGVAVASRRFDRVAALAQGCEAARGAQDIVQ